MNTYFTTGFEKKASRMGAMHRLFKAESQVAGSGERFINTAKKAVKDVAEDDPYRMFRPKPMKSFHGYQGPGVQN